MSKPSDSVKRLNEVVNALKQSAANQEATYNINCLIGMIALLLKQAGEHDDSRWFWDRHYPDLFK